MLFVSYVFYVSYLLGPFLTSKRRLRRDKRSMLSLAAHRTLSIFCLLKYLIRDISSLKSTKKILNEKIKVSHTKQKIITLIPSKPSEKRYEHVSYAKEKKGH